MNSLSLWWRRRCRKSQDCERTVTLAYVLSRKPPPSKVAKRPIGVIRAEFDRALLLRDEASAAGLLEELRGTGRSAMKTFATWMYAFGQGLALWPQLANDHWLVKTLSELVLPPQILADLIEALYRTHLDHVESEGDPRALMDALNEHISGRYPSLFASRRGVRTPRVVKASSFSSDANRHRTHKSSMT